MKALIITGRGVQDQELVYPQYRLQEAGYAVTIAAPEMEFQGIQGTKFKADVSIYDEAEVEDGYDILAIPGGVKCMEHLRLNAAALCLIRWARARKRSVIAATCSGPLLLVAADIVKGLHIACYPAWRVDIENAGAKFVDAPAVVDDRVVTSTHYRHLGAWMAATLIAAVS